MMTENEVRVRLSRGVADLPAPAPSAAALRRIHARVAAGDIPALDAERRRPPAPVWIWWGLAAAGVAAAVTLLPGDDPRSRPDRDAPVEEAWMFGPPPLAAQALAPGSPRIGLLDGSKLPLGQWVYAAQPPGDAVTSAVGRYDTASIARVAVDGHPALSITWSWGSRVDGGPMVDSIFVTADAFRPLRRVFVLRTGSRLTTLFGTDSVTRTWLRPDGSVERLGVPVSRDAEWVRGATLAGHQEWAMFPLLPLHRGWRGHVATAGMANTGELVTLYWAYRVTGEGRITVPAGSFDCWRVQYEADAGDGVFDFTYWVDKRTGWMVKAGSPGSRFGREQVLVSYRPL